MIAYVLMDFPMTFGTPGMGFPGEGPFQQNMTLVSANIGSVMTDVTWKTWNADLICPQETRIGKNNFRTDLKGLVLLPALETFFLAFGMVPSPPKPHPEVL